MKVPHWLRQIWAYRLSFVVVLAPLLLLPLPLVIPRSEAYCAYIILLMAIYWITEAIPLAVTAFLPLILFPITGIMTARDVSRTYFPDTNWLFIGGLMIAVAVEDSGLHKRISLRVLMIFGTKPRCLMLSFMLVTFFLSMWISNTATTAMMLPIVEAVFEELKAEDERKFEKKDVHFDDLTIAEECNNDKPSQSSSTNQNIYINETYEDHENITNIGEEETVKQGTSFHNDPASSPNECESTIVESDAKRQKRMDNLIKGITLCVPYAASIGGTATLTGTAPNLVLSGQFEEIFPDAPQLLSFGSWLAYCFPGALLTLILSYFWLSWFFLGFDIKEIKSCFTCYEKTQGEINAQTVLRNEYKKLGSMRWVEGTVLIVFIITALLWFFRDPGFMPGWSVIFQDGYISDGTVAMTMAFLLFLLPRERPEFLCNSKGNDLMKPSQPVVDWPTMHKKFPWSVAFLLAGGFALANGATVSGFSRWMGDQLAVLNGIEPWLICLIITIIVCLFTECSSNTATASLFVPILAQLAQAVNVHPLFLMIAPVIASSMAFMLPVATPPNAIAFSFGHLKVFDLVKAGWMLNIIGILVITLFINTYGVSYFNFNVLPSWADYPSLYTTTTASTSAFTNSTV